MSETEVKRKLVATRIRAGRSTVDLLVSDKDFSRREGVMHITAEDEHRCYYGFEGGTCSLSDSFLNTHLDCGGGHPDKIYYLRITEAYIANHKPEFKAS